VSAGPRVLVAPDSFKGTFTASQVAEAIGRGVESGGGRAVLAPVADGGEGTLDVLLRALGGKLRSVDAHDPLGRAVEAAYGITGDGTAIVEMARASGLGLVAAGERDAEAASTRGTGELVAAAVAGGAREVVVTVGGSATTDGGAGAVAAIEAAGGLRGARLLVLCDVATPFEHAAEVYGPQKGADPATVERLTARLHALATRYERDPRGVPMTGAAGGLAGGLWAALGAELVPGADWVLDALGFDALLAEADAVVAGEGRLDRQTFEGKIVGRVAERCRRAAKPLHAVVGACALADEQVAALGLASVQEAPDAAAMIAAGRAIAHETRDRTVR